MTHELIYYAATDAIPPQQPYFIRRSSFGNFPIYHLRKRGGNLLQTVIRKTEGDVEALRAELMQEFQLGEKEVLVNQLTRHITLKVGAPVGHPGFIFLFFHEQGLRKVQVGKFLEQRGF